jgi:hypothetical protein
MGTSDLLDTAERREYVLKMRRAGATYRDIAAAAVREFGIDNLPGGWGERYAHKDVKRELEKLRDQIADDAGAVRTLELERIDRMLLGIWTRAAQGDYSAIDRVLKLMKRRADLMGLDAPTRTELTGKDGGPIESVHAGLTDTERAEKLDALIDALVEQRIDGEE